MLKPLIRRSQFQLIDISTATDIMVEADEAYVTQLTPSVVAMKIQRDRERRLSAFLAANPAITGGAVQVFGTLDTTYGRVPLEAPLDLNGKLTNKLVTTAAGDLTQAERRDLMSVGMKEWVTFAPVTDGSNSKVLLELVHYSPEDKLGA